jgi:hypothetical protein
MISRLRENTRRKRVREVNHNYWTPLLAAGASARIAYISRPGCKWPSFGPVTSRAIDRVARVADALGSR